MTGEIFSVEGGNVKLVEGLIKNSTMAGARYEFDTSVNLVVHDAATEKFILYGGGGGDEKKLLGEFDKVVLCVPLQQSGIDFKERSLVDGTVLYDMPLGIMNARTTTSYITTITTVVEAKGLRQNFGNVENMPSSMYFASANDESVLYGEHGIFSISLLKVSSDGSRMLYKIFSEQVLGEDDEMLRVFVDGKILYSQSWQAGASNLVHDAEGTSIFSGGAYPNFGIILDSADSLPTSFKIHDSGIYYPSAFESTGSAMELAAVGAKVVSNIILDDLKREREKPHAREGAGMHRGHEF